MTTHALLSSPHIIHSIALGPGTGAVARGLFGALRELDDRVGCVGIFVEGLSENDEEIDRGDGKGLAAAVMNRLSKAASGI